MQITRFLLFCLFSSSFAYRLNWASLDEKGPDGGSLLGFTLGSVVAANDSLLNPNPNSTQSLRNRIASTYQDEEAIWDGILAGELDPVPTYLYFKTMPEITSVINNFLRETYTTIFQDVDLSICNTIQTPPEIILDSNLGFGPNIILLNNTEINLLIPPHTCEAPFFGLSPDFNLIRKFPATYKNYLVDLVQFLECILLYNAFPSYAKGVSCLEDYYFGSQDAGANPAFFDIMAHKQDLQNTVDTFVSGSYPIDVTTIVSVSWTDFQNELNIARQYKDLARKVRYTSSLIYNAITRNYARLRRVSTCRTLESQIYQSGQNTSKFWCGYQSCYEDIHQFSLIGVEYLSGPLEPGITNICENNTCGLTDTYPDPFYCDSTHDCPNTWFCSLITRRCYKTSQLATFSRSYNTTICGYSRKLTDASVISGTVISAFGGTVNQSSFSFKTYWPQNCTTVVTLTPDLSQPLDLGPFDFAQVCYPWSAGYNESLFYSNGTTDCSILDQTTICFYNVVYIKYVDGIGVELRNDTFCVNRTSLGAQPWQLSHCKINGPQPENFVDYGSYNPSTNNGTAYMNCSSSTNCVTTNSTHACFHNVQDILRIYDHYLSTNDIQCVDQRIYNYSSNIIDNYTDPNGASFPPSPEAVPSGYTDSTYFSVSSSNFVSVSGTYTTTGGTAPTSLTGYEHAEFVGYYFIQSSTGPFVYKIMGRVTFHTSCTSPTSCANTIYTEGADYFITTNTAVSLEPLPTLAVNNQTGVLLFDPLTDAHPNPRFDDPLECFFLEITSLANVPMTQSPVQPRTQFKNYWISDVTARNDPPNATPVLYPCAAIFLRKIVYVQNTAWLDGPSTDFPLGLADGDLRYVCQRSLQMAATCVRFGMPMTSTQYTDILNTVNPPSETTIFIL